MIFCHKMNDARPAIICMALMLYVNTPLNSGRVSERREMEGGGQFVFSSSIVYWKETLSNTQYSTECSVVL